MFHLPSPNSSPHTPRPSSPPSRPAQKRKEEVAQYSANRTNSDDDRRDIPPVAGKTLVTGGAGFIGSHLVASLAADHQPIAIYDNMSTGRIENIQDSLQQKRVKLIEGDIRNGSELAAQMPDISSVVHLAAIADHEICLKNPLLANEVNGTGTRVVLEMARRAGVRRFIYASSAALYGEPSKLPVSEDAPVSPLAPYGASKLAGERYCLEYSRGYGMGVVCFRFFNVFGPRQTATQYSGVITEFMKKLRNREPPTIYGDGLQTRDFVNIRDIVDAIVLALGSKTAEGVYNIATGRETTINQLATTLTKISNQSISPVHEAARVGDIRRSVADISRAQADLRFNPKTNLENDLRELWDWHLNP
jgi:UDP-glucose 4-epimerase